MTLELFRIWAVALLLCAGCTQTPATTAEDSAADPVPRSTAIELDETTESTELASEAEDCEAPSPGLTAASWTSETATTDAIEEPVGVIDVSVWESTTCTTVTITFGDEDGAVDELPGGIEVDSSLTESRLTFPASIDLLALPPARRAFWQDGFAVPVIDDTGHYVLIRDGSGALPVIEASADPAQMTIGFPNGDGQAVVTLADAFIIDELFEVEPGRIRVSGFGAAFEAHAAVGVVDADGAWSHEEWTVDSATSVSGMAIRMGNPGVAWAPFSFDLIGLPAGTYGLYLDSCGGQCDVEAFPETLPFTVTTN